jgi:hypothetical protein
MWVHCSCTDGCEASCGCWDLILRSSGQPAHSGRPHSLSPCLLQPKDLFIILLKYTVSDFRDTRRGRRVSLRVAVSHHVIAGIWTQELQKNSQWLAEPSHQPPWTRLSLDELECFLSLKTNISEKTYSNMIQCNKEIIQWVWMWSPHAIDPWTDRSWKAEVPALGGDAVVRALKPFFGFVFSVSLCSSRLMWDILTGYLELVSILVPQRLTAKEHAPPHPAP